MYEVPELFVSHHELPEGDAWWRSWAHFHSPQLKGMIVSVHICTWTMYLCPIMYCLRLGHHGVHGWAEQNKRTYPCTFIEIDDNYYFNNMFKFCFKNGSLSFQSLLYNLKVIPRNFLQGAFYFSILNNLIIDVLLSCYAVKFCKIFYLKVLVGILLKFTKFL